MLLKISCLKGKSQDRRHTHAHLSRTSYSPSDQWDATKISCLKEKSQAQDRRHTHAYLSRTSYSPTHPMTSELLLKISCLKGKSQGRRQTHAHLSSTSYTHHPGTSEMLLKISCLKGKSQERLQTHAHLSRTSYRSPRDQSPYFKRSWSPGIDSKEWIPPAYLAWRAGTLTLFLLGS